MDPLERAVKLKQEADQVLELIKLREILQPYGELFATGSYFLDVMAYPDIDFYIPKLNLEQLFAIGARIASCNLVIQIVYEPTDNPILLPEGLYLKSRVRYGDWGRPWKIDLWSLAEAVIQDKMNDMQRFFDRMTPEIRQQIIRYKLSILTSQLRTPMYSGYYIYKAFIDEGLTDFNQVTDYLYSCGIRVDRSH